MTADHGAPSPSGLDLAAVIARHLECENPVIRSLAAKAMGHVGGNLAAAALIGALMDPDPDVRTDAMVALGASARPEDVPQIRRSLIGDPVREVKIAALRVLVRLGDRTSIPLMRRLAADRSEDTVSWEDADGMWDDWLDVQIAAVEALGDLGASDAIDELLAARGDEFGQDLDHVVFSALARIGDDGVAALTRLLADPDDRIRARALTALSDARPEILAPMLDRFVADPSPDVRLLAVSCAAPESVQAQRLALQDPDAAVRLRAVSAYGGRRPDIATAALADRDEAVRASALEHVALHPDYSANGDLLANVTAWLRSAGPTLAATCAIVLPRLAGQHAAGPLIVLAADDTRPAEARAAALGGLGQVAGARAVEQLRASSIDPMRPIRVAALAGLARICGEGTSTAERVLAEAALADAMAGDLYTTNAADANQASDVEDGGLIASKGEGDGRRPVTITRDGEIIEQAGAPEPEPAPSSDSSQANLIADRFPRSTLEAIQVPASAGSGEGSVTLSQSDLSFLELARGGRRRGRVSVDGPSEIGDDLRVAALRIGACCGGESIEQSIARALEARAQQVRVAAFEALARRTEAGPVSTMVVDLVSAAVSDTDSLVRGYCARILRAASPDAPALLSKQIADPDPTVRAEALKAVAAESGQRWLAALTDPSSIVRATALQLALEHGDTREFAQALAICLERGLSDVLRKAWQSSPIARDLIARALADSNGTARQFQIALDSIPDAALS